MTRTQDPARTASPTPTTSVTLRHGLAALAADLPRFASAPLCRRWHLRWGATDDELAAPMAGDHLVDGAQYRSTRAITIAAPPEAVWPWLVQVGCRRAGWYSNDLLDNLGRPSATVVVPELQDLAVGQWVPMSPTPSERSAFTVAGFEVERWLLWRQPTSTWAWQLTPLPGDGTRLVTRLRVRYEWRRPLDAALALVLCEVGDFPMMRRMLYGIRDRAEALAGRTA